MNNPQSQAHADAMRCAKDLAGYRACPCDECSGEIAERILRELKLEELYQCVEALRELKEIVEGVSSTRWGNGVQRFKDTAQWCNAYSALSALEKGKV